MHCFNDDRKQTFPDVHVCHHTIKTCRKKCDIIDCRVHVCHCASKVVEAKRICLRCRQGKLVVRFASSPCARTLSWGSSHLSVHLLQIKKRRSLENSPRRRQSYCGTHCVQTHHAKCSCEPPRNEPFLCVSTLLKTSFFPSAHIPFQFLHARTHARTHTRTHAHTHLALNRSRSVGHAEARTPCSFGNTLH